MSLRHYYLFAVCWLCLSSTATSQTRDVSAWRNTASAPAQREDRPATTARPTFPALAPRSTSGTDSKNRDEKQAGGSLFAPSVTVASSLAVVLGLFAGMIWLTRRFGAGAKSNGILPREALEVLGTTTLQPRLTVSLVRVGTRVVVLAQTAQGVQTLAEITDLDEANHLIATCRGESTAGFAKELHAVEREPISRGFVEPTDASVRGRRLFASA